MGGGLSKDLQVMASREWSGTGKVAIVTGPTGEKGIGWFTAKWLAERGAHVVLAGRSARRLEECVTQIRAAAKNADGSKNENLILTPLVLDVGSLASVETFAKNFLALNLPLQLLICNAGIMAMPYGHTVDGFEQQVGTNHVGHYHLTRLLLAKLLASAPSRLVTVSSMGHKLCSIELNSDAAALDATAFHPTEKSYGKWTSYGNSKLGNILLAKQINKLYSAQGLTAYSLHPGVVATNLGSQDFLFGCLSKVISFALKTPEGGAGTSVYCASSEQVLTNAGAFFDDCGVSTSASEQANSEALWQVMWDTTEAQIEAANAKRAAAAAAPA